MNAQVRNTIISFFLILFLFVVPDIIFSLFNESFKVSRHAVGLFLIVPLSMGLVLNPYRSLSIFIISTLATLQVMQFFHISYFGRQISPFALYLMQNELSDVLLEAQHLITSYLYIIPIVIIPFLAIFYFTKCKTYKHRVGAFILLSLFVFDGTRLYMSKTSRFNPNETRLTIDNSINALFGYLIIKAKKYDIVDYKPYEIIDLKTSDNNQPINIVYIIGESVNYNHMSLFGYEKNTTPKLKELSKMDNFYYTKGISGAIATLASSKFMMNAIREPDNIRLTSSEDTNLFRLAKQKGFKTFYLSAQEDDIVPSIGTAKNIDVLVTKNDLPKKDSKTNDERVFDVFSKQTLTGKNFIVLHHRCAHGPHLKSISEEYKNNDDLPIEYDRDISYVDYLVTKTFNLFNKNGGKFYVVFASDHNELLGEGGVNGHTILIPESADIPMFFQSNDETFMKKIKSIFKPSHYEVAKNIANIIGFEIQNPNEVDNVFYINGVDYNGRCGHIKFKKDLDNQKIIYMNE